LAEKIRTAKRRKTDRCELRSCAFFVKNKEIAAINLLPRSDNMNARYKNPDNDPRGIWASGDSLRREFHEYACYEITIPSGRKVVPPPGTSWRFNKEEVPRLMAENRLWFGTDGMASHV